MDLRKYWRKRTMKTCKEMLLDENESYEDRKEIYTDLRTIESYSGWLFSCADTIEETKALFDTILNLISAQRLKREAAIRGQEEEDIAGITDFKNVIEKEEEKYEANNSGQPTLDSYY